MSLYVIACGRVVLYVIDHHVGLGIIIVLYLIDCGPWYNNCAFSFVKV